ncbi:MAG: hypothetical protein ACO33A_09800, partial [Hyphomonas sp.]
MTENLRQMTGIICQRKTQPGVQSSAGFDHPAHRDAAFDGRRKAKRVTLTVRSGDSETWRPRTSIPKMSRR